jgi:hypothetical protein
MTNPSKAKGTAAETAVTRYAREHGFPLADRRPLKGISDEGDILLAPGAILEVKAGKAAQGASYNQVLAWMADTERERVSARADFGGLVTQRRGFGIGRVESWCFWYVQPFPLPALACLTLEDGLRMLRHSGWGKAL